MAEESFETVAARLDGALAAARARVDAAGILIVEWHNRSGFEHSGYWQKSWGVSFEHRAERGGYMSKAVVTVAYRERTEWSTDHGFAATWAAEVFPVGRPSVFRTGGSLGTPVERVVADMAAIVIQGIERGAEAIRLCGLMTR